MSGSRKSCLLYLALFGKSGYSEVLGTLRQGPWGPGEVKIEIFFKILDDLEHTLPTMPLQTTIIIGNL